MNRKSIQILRGSENYDPKKSAEKLLDGQPFYSKQDRYLYIGDGETELRNLKPIAKLVNNQYGADDPNLQSATLTVGNTESILRRSLAIAEGDSSKVFAYTGYKNPGESFTRDSGMLIANTPIENAIAAYKPTKALAVGYPKDLDDASNLNYLLQIFTSQDDGKLYGAPRIHYKHKVMMQLLFNDQSFMENGASGPQMIVVVGNYLSDRVAGYNAGMDPAVYGKDNNTGGYNIPDFQNFANSYLNIQNAFLQITGRGFNVEYCFIGEFNSAQEKTIRAPITSYFIGGANEGNPLSSHTMWFHSPSWGMTNNKANFVHMNLYDSPYTGIITQIVDNCAVAPYENLIQEK